MSGEVERLQRRWLEEERQSREAEVRRLADDLVAQQSGGQRDGTRNDRSCSPPRRAGELDPEWVMCSVDVPAGKRLYASRDLKGSAFKLAMDQYGNGDGWHLTTTMQHMLVITKPTYAECLAELMRIWANWDKEGRELPAGHGTGRRGQRGEVTA